MFFRKRRKGLKCKTKRKSVELHIMAVNQQFLGKSSESSCSTKSQWCVSCKLLQRWHGIHREWPIYAGEILLGHTGPLALTKLVPCRAYGCEIMGPTSPARAGGWVHQSAVTYPVWCNLAQVWPQPTLHWGVTYSQENHSFQFMSWRFHDMTLDEPHFAPSWLWS